MISIVAQLSIPSFIAVSAYYKKWLTPAASVTGFILSAIVSFTGLAEVMALLVFFLVGTLATKISDKFVKKRNKHKQDSEYEVISYESAEHSDVKKGRDSYQVLATAGIPALVCLLITIFGPQISVINIGSLYFAFFACDMADTLASEVGVLSKSEPLLLTTLEKVPRGTDGAISFEGTLASLIGGAMIGFISIFSRLKLPESMHTSILHYTMVGFIGCLLDSLLGCFFQKPVIIQANPDNWKQLNTLVNLYSGVATMFVDIMFQVSPLVSISVSFVISVILLLLLAR